MKEIITLTNCLRLKLKNKETNQLRAIIGAMLTIRGRITMLGLSRWSEKGGSFRTISRFFHSVFNWAEINWLFIQEYLLNNGVFLLAGDEVVVSKSGKKTYGLSRFYSSIQNQVIKSISFLNISLISVETRKAYPLVNKQITSAVKDGCVKDKTSKNTKQEKGKAGRKKGSKNKNLKDIELSPYLLFVQKTIMTLLVLIGKKIKITYFVFDGAFGNNGAVQMVLRTGLQIISKLQKNSALFFPNLDNQKRVGAPKKYGKQLDYNNIPNTYLKETSTLKDIETKIYQMNLRHKRFADMLNVVITIKRNIKTDKKAMIILYSTDLKLDYKNLIDYYSLRFQVEFVFRDAKQYWGMEDFMNVKENPVNNGANLSTFMVNFSYGVRKELNNETMSVNDLKAYYHGIKYANEVFKLVPEIGDEILISKIYDKISVIGAINERKMVA
jgi:hypothetical protein